LRARAPLITAYAADVSDPSSVDIAVNSIIAAHGHIDHLVTSAGICENFPALSYPYSRLEKMWAVNVNGTYCFAVAVAKHLVARGRHGSMAFIGSMSGGIVNIPQYQTPYNMSKAAVCHMAKSLAIEWASLGIRVNCISPGYVLTPL
jgi:NAD(P)-dependent dehydrogenase (short-subunit alcohol dehydrogenase family)